MNKRIVAAVAAVGVVVLGVIAAVVLNDSREASDRLHQQVEVMQSQQAAQQSQAAAEKSAQAAASASAKASAEAAANAKAAADRAAAEAANTAAQQAKTAAEKAAADARAQANKRATEAAARSVVTNCFDAINMGDLDRAWALGEKNIYPSKESFRQHFADISYIQYEITGTDGGRVYVSLHTVHITQADVYWVGWYNVSNGVITSNHLR